MISQKNKKKKRSVKFYDRSSGTAGGADCTECSVRKCRDCGDFFKWYQVRKDVGGGRQAVPEGWRP